jgi:hypothetical protein
MPLGSDATRHRKENALALTPGRRVWIPCQVKPGPFSDERMVRVESESGSWLGFVPVSSLRDSFLEGTTFVSAVVVEVRGDRFTARLPGHPITPGFFQGSVEKATPVRALQA